MKKIFIGLIFTLLVCGCDEVIKPVHLQDPEMLGWIYRDCIDQSLAKKIRGDFISDVRRHTLKVEGFESVGILEDAVIYTFEYAQMPIRHICYNVWEEKWEQHPAYTLKEYMKDYGDVTDILSRDFEITQAIVDNNRQKAQLLYTELIKEFFSYFERVALDQFNVLSWGYDKGAQGDSYTGYLIEYEVGEGYYVLLSLIEYDKTDRYKADIIYKGTSLQELNNCYE